MGKRSKRGLTLEQHKVLGRALKTHYCEMLKASCVISNTYGHTSKASRLAAKALAAIQDLRYELDNTVAQENPQASDREVVGAYYGWSGTEETVENSALQQLYEDSLT